MEVEKNEFEDITLDGLEVIATLGVGGFGRVDLVRKMKYALDMYVYFL